MVFDIETYPNIFTFCGYDYENKTWFLYELSDRKDEKEQLIQCLEYYANLGYYFVGYNNIGFDYPIIHNLLLDPNNFNYTRAAQLAHQIIFNRDSFKTIWHNERKLKQIDLYKINHFDNKAKVTSLKALQVAMRSVSVEDLPFDIRPLNNEEKDVLIKYNFHDVAETVKFLEKNMHLIQNRKDILDSGMLTGDVLNMSDVKIGVEFLINSIGRDKCYTEDRQPRQTVLQSVDIKNVILPKIEFTIPEFGEVLEWYKGKTWYSYKDNDIKLSKTINDFTYDFGVGGIHGSVDNKKFVANDNWEIIDLDVASLYPSIAIANRFYPMHLGESFVEKYFNLKQERFKHAKGTALNAMFKLALNGAYGNSNNPYSPFYDPSFMLKITVNGQLQLFQLAEKLFLLPNVHPIQINTDGLTVYAHKSMRPWINILKSQWEADTGLELEEANYSRMWVRDVNSYLALTTKGKFKAKGAYWYPEDWKDYDGWWNKDYSAMVVQKAARLALVNDLNPAMSVPLITNPHDFMLRYKTPSGAQLYVGDKPTTKTVRYYVSKTGEPMFKSAKPKGKIGDWKRKNSLTDEYFNSVLKTIPEGQWDERIHTANKSKYDTVKTRIEANQLVKVCNNVLDFNGADVNFDYYIKETEKLVNNFTEVNL